MKQSSDEVVNYEDMAHRIGTFAVACELIVRKLEAEAKEAALLDAKELLVRINLVRKKLREMHTKINGKTWITKK